MTVKVYKPNDFIKEFDDMDTAFDFMEDNNYKTYTIYCGVF